VDKLVRYRRDARGCESSPGMRVQVGSKLIAANRGSERDGVEDDSGPAPHTIPSEAHFPTAQDGFIIARQVRFARLLVAAASPARLAPGQRRLVQCRRVCWVDSRRQHGPGAARRRGRFADDMHDPVRRRPLHHDRGGVPPGQLGFHPLRQPDLRRLPDNKRGFTARLDSGGDNTAQPASARSSRSQLIGYNGVNIEDKRVRDRDLWPDATATGLVAASARRMAALSHTAVTGRLVHALFIDERPVVPIGRAIYGPAVL